jgi:DNA-binding transcriptional ArsR family regulator
MAYDNLARSFAALGEPNRQRIVERLAGGPASVGDLAEGLPISRPAVSQHLRALKEAGLVTDQAMGTRRIYRLDPRGIGAMRDALDAHWRRALGNFRQFADRLADEEEGKDRT